MAKTLDDLVQACLGMQELQILRLQADNDALRERVAALEAEKAKLTAPPEAEKPAQP